MLRRDQPGCCHAGSRDASCGKRGKLEQTSAALHVLPVACTTSSVLHHRVLQHSLQDAHP
eukprot:4983145-Alexandrium_andersonii.AAC.1